MTDRFNLFDMLSVLEHVEHDMLNDEEVDEAVVSRLESCVRPMISHLDKCSEDKEELAQIYAASERIRVVAQTRLSLEERGEEIFSKVFSEALQAPSSTTSQARTDTLTDFSESVPSYHMRKHFLSMLDDPYPDQAEKLQLVKAINEYFAKSVSPPRLCVLRLEQLGLWYINARRRSGWSHILGKYARNDRKRMKALMQARMLEDHLPIRSPLDASAGVDVKSLLRDNLGPTYTISSQQEFKDDWDAMLSWIRYGVKDKVSNWIQDIVDESKKTSKKQIKPRAVSNAAKKTPGRRSHAGRQTKASEESPSKASSRSDKAESEWSSSSAGDCSAFFSGSSADSMSSLDASLTYGLDMASPTLNIARGRQIKALPSRTQSTLNPADTRLCKRCSAICVPCSYEQPVSEQSLCCFRLNQMPFADIRLLFRSIHSLEFIISASSLWPLRAV
nr:homeodomain transcription factor bE [Farysia itapuensis]